MQLTPTADHITSAHDGVIKLKQFSALLSLCEGNPPVTDGFPSQRPATWGFDIFFDLCLNKRLRKHSRRRWFETQSHSLWRHCNFLRTNNVWWRHDMRPFCITEPFLAQSTGDQRISIAQARKEVLGCYLVCLFLFLSNISRQLNYQWLEMSLRNLARQELNSPVLHYMDH